MTRKQDIFRGGWYGGYLVDSGFFAQFNAHELALHKLYHPSEWLG